MTNQSSVLPTVRFHQDVPIKFFKNFQRAETVILDHSGLALFKQCPRRYFYRIVLGLEPKQFAIVLHWGTCYHLFREVLEKNKHHGDDVAFTAAFNAAVNKFNQGQKPVPGTDYDFMTEGRFKQALAVAFKNVLEERKKGKIEVLYPEQPFAIELPNGVKRSGRLDQILKFGGRLWIRDFKASKKNESWYTKLLKPNNQLTTYMYAAQYLTNSNNVQGAFIEVLWNTKQKGPEIYQHSTNRTSDEFKEWERDQKHWDDEINRCRDNDSYPMHESNGCAYCPYHEVCTIPSEAGKASVLKNRFKFNVWDPLTHGESD